MIPHQAQREQLISFEMFRIFQENDIPDSEDEFAYAVGEICGHLLRS